MFNIRKAALNEDVLSARKKKIWDENEQSKNLVFNSIAFYNK